MTPDLQEAIKLAETVAKYPDHRNYPTFRHAERFGLVAETGSKVVFWFEKFPTA